MERSKEHLDPPKNHTPRTSAQAPIRSRSLSRSRPTLGCGHGFKVPGTQPCEVPFFGEVCPTELEQPREGPSFLGLPHGAGSLPFPVHEGREVVQYLLGGLLPLSFRPRTIRHRSHRMNNGYEVMETPQNFCSEPSHLCARAAFRRIHTITTWQRLPYTTL